MSNNPDSKNEFLLKYCFLGLPSDSYKQFLASFDFNISSSKFLGGMEIVTTRFDVDDKPVKVIQCLIDNSEFSSKLRPSYYRGASAAILFFDKSDRQSFEAVPNWLEDFRKYIPSSPKITWKRGYKEVINPSSHPVVLAGITLKPSMHREPEIIISSEEAQSLADQLDLPYFDFSYRTSQKQFENLLKQIARLSLDEKPRK